MQIDGAVLAHWSKGVCQSLSVCHSIACTTNTKRHIPFSQFYSLTKMFNFFADNNSR